MKTISYLTEPAKYTLDLIESVHIPLKIDVVFLQRNTFVKSDKLKEHCNLTFLNELSFFKRFKKLYNDYQNYDIIVFNGYDRFDFLLLWFIHLISKNKTPIGLESDTPIYIPKNYFKRIIKEKYLNNIFKNKWVHGLAGGNDTHRKLFSYYGMSEAKIHFLPMVIDVEKFSFNPIRNRAKNFTFIYVGRFEKIKKIDIIINEFLIAFNDNLNVTLKLIGDGSLKSNLELKYKKCQNIIFTGKLFDNDLKIEYEQAHVLVLSSIKDNWGLVINEALSASLPVLSSNYVGANYDLIEDKNTGFTFDPHKRGDLAQKMKLLFENNSIFERFAHNGYELMHNYWNYDLYQKQFLLSANKMKNEKVI